MKHKCFIRILHEGLINQSIIVRTYQGSHLLSIRWKLVINALIIEILDLEVV
jgi:hypothetical protein